MSARKVCLHLFCSAKGGVGKSSLAVVLSKMLAATGGEPILIDSDLLGTALADGLRLRAPKIATQPDGTLDLETLPTGDFLTVDETRRHRLYRKASNDFQAPRWLPYLNDALAFQADEEHECRLDSMVWRHDSEERVRYLPSSSLKNDILTARSWLDTSREFDWLRRLAWLIDAALLQMPALTDVVLDLPPGLWGFAHEALVLASHLMQRDALPEGYPQWSDIDWDVNATLVTSSDANDLVMAVEYRLESYTHVPRLQLCLNRRTEPKQVVIDRVVDRLGAVAEKLDLLGELRSFDEVRAVQRIFRDGDVNLADIGSAFEWLMPSRVSRSDRGSERR